MKVILALNCFILILFTLIFNSCQLNKEIEPIDSRLSKYFPAPFYSNNYSQIDSVDLFDPSLFKELITIHRKLYTEVNLDSARIVINNVKDKLKSNKYNIWYSERIRLDEAFYFQRERDFLQAKAILEESYVNPKDDTLLYFDKIGLLMEIEMRLLNFSKIYNINNEINILSTNINDDRILKIKTLNLLAVVNDSLEYSIVEENKIFKENCDSKKCIAEYHRINSIHYYQNHDYQLAIEHALKSVELYNSIHDIYNKSALFYETSNLYIKTNNPTLAKYYAKKSISNYQTNQEYSDTYQISLNAKLLESSQKYFEMSRDVIFGEKLLEKYDKVLNQLEQTNKFNTNTYHFLRYFHSNLYTSIIQISSQLYDLSLNEYYLKRLVQYVVDFKSSSLFRLKKLNKNRSHYKHGNKIRDLIQLEYEINNKIIANKISETRQLIEKEKDISDELKENDIEFYQKIVSKNQIDIEKLLEYNKNENSAIILYHVGASIYNDNEIIACSIFKGKIKKYKIKDEKFIKQLTHNVYMCNSSREIINEECNNSRENLYMHLFQHIYEHIKDARQFIILPDSYLCSIPFSHFKIKTDKGQKYLVENHNISYLYLLNNEIFPLKNNTILNQSNFAGFSWSDPETIRSENPSKELVSAYQEIITATEFFKPNQVTIRTGNKFTKKEFQRTAINSEILHIGTHSTTNKPSHLENGLQCRNTDGMEIISINEIEHGTIRPHLLILASCKSGAGEIDESEGFLSIGRSFYAAGSNNIINCLWNQDDHVSKEIIQLFYKHLSQTQNTNKSINNAQRDYIGLYPNAKIHDWAGFTLYN